VHLSLIPLQRSSLGSAARGLELANDSGVLSSGAELDHGFFGTFNPRGIGRITG
jgi:hypothetical protein